MGPLFIFGAMAAAVSPAELELALDASGRSPRSASDLKAVLQQALERDPARASEEARATALLAWLHGPEGPLRAYEASATTLADILERGAYNCVSASTLYVLAARGLDLQAEAELLPTHARARVWSPSRKAWIRVETTSPHGFDPDPETEARVAARIASAVEAERALVDEGGLQVSFRALVGAMYANRATLAQAAGEIGEAERLFAEAEALMSTERARRVLRAQRAALLARLADAARDEDGPGGILRARDLLRMALELGPEDPALRAGLAQNLEALTHEIVGGRLAAGEEAEAEAAVRAAEAVLPRPRAIAVRASLLAERGRLALERGAPEAGAAHLTAADALELGEDHAELARAIDLNLGAGLDAAAESAALAGDLAAAKRWLERRQAFRLLPEAEARARRRRLGRLAGHHFLEAGALEAAALRFRGCEAWIPGGCRDDLVATLQRLVLPLVREGRCGAAAPVIEELAELGGSEAFLASVKEACGPRNEKRRPPPKE